jgi:release factor glutamine methyltransferase
VLQYEPHVALFVQGDDALLFYRRIATLGKTLLKPNGLLAFEINRAYGGEVKQLLEEQGYQDVRIEQDLFGNDRFDYGRMKNEQ